MAGNDIERKLNEYRLLKSRQRQAERQSLKPLWEQILPERIATVFKSVKSNESIQEVDHNVEDSSPEHNIILNPVNESSSTKRRRVKQADVSTEAEALIDDESDAQREPEERLPGDSFQWLILSCKVALWLVLYLLCLELEIGAIFVIISAFYVILSNLSNRRKKPWEPSAYSVFNPNCEAIDGSIDPKQLEKQIGYGF